MCVRERETERERERERREREREKGGFAGEGANEEERKRGPEEKDLADDDRRSHFGCFRLGGMFVSNKRGRSTYSQRRLNRAFSVIPGRIFGTSFSIYAAWPQARTGIQFGELEHLAILKFVDGLFGKLVSDW